VQYISYTSSSSSFSSYITLAKVYSPSHLLPFHLVLQYRQGLSEWKYRIQWHSSTASGVTPESSEAARSAVVTATSKLRNRSADNLLMLRVWTEGHSKLTIYAKLTMGDRPVVGAALTAEATYIPLEERGGLKVSAVKQTKLTAVPMVDDGHAGA
jgi:hypothetical protein